MVPDHFKKEWLAKGVPLSKEMGTRFRSALGGVSFGAVQSRPDLAAPAGILAEGQSEPTDRHLQGALNVIRYAVTTSDRVLCFPVQGPGGEAKVIDEITLAGVFDANFLPDKPRMGYFSADCKYDF